VGPRAGLDTVEKRKIPSLRREIEPPNPVRPARSQSLYRLRYHGSYKLNLYLKKVQLNTETINEEQKTLVTSEESIF
jgi:hypothetical protein